MLNYKAIVNILSAMLVFLAGALLFPAAIAWFYQDGDLNAFLYTIGLTFVTGASGFFFNAQQW